MGCWLNCILSDTNRILRGDRTVIDSMCDPPHADIAWFPVQICIAYCHRHFLDLFFWQEVFIVRDGSRRVH